jgi:hypothetical protein
LALDQRPIFPKELASITRTPGAGGAGVGNPYVTFGTSAELTNDRILTQGTGITITDAGTDGGPLTVAVASTVYRSGGTDVPIADGGTGASTQSGARLNLGVPAQTDVDSLAAEVAQLLAADLPPVLPPDLRRATVVNHQTIGGQAATILTADGLNPTLPAPLVIYHHGAGEDQDALLTDALKAGIVSAMLDAGFIVAGSNAHGNNWGNQNSLDDYSALYTYISANFNISAVIHLSQSMGGISGLLCTAAGSPVPAAWVGIYPACSLSAAFGANAGIFAADIRAAYGIASDGSDYAAKTAGHDPLLIAASTFAGRRLRFYASTGDTVIPRASHSDPMAVHVSGTAAEATVISCTGNHGDPSHFQPANLLFFEGNSLLTTFSTPATVTELSAAVRRLEVAHAAIESAEASKCPDISAVHTTGAESITGFKTLHDGIAIGDGPIRIIGNATLTGFGGIEFVNDPTSGFQMASSGYDFRDVGNTKSYLSVSPGTGGTVGINTTGPAFYQLQVAPNLPNRPVLGIFGQGSQTANLIDIGLSGVAVFCGVTEGGSIYVARTTQPADGELAAGEAALWYDPTNGAPDLRWRVKTNDGTAVTVAYQKADAELTALAGLTSAADTLAYFTGPGAAATTPFTAAGRALVDDADAAAQRTTLGLVIGTNVLAPTGSGASLTGITAAQVGSVPGGVLKGFGGALAAATEGTDYLSGASNKLPLAFSFGGANSNATGDDLCPWHYVSYADTIIRIILSTSAAVTGTFTVRIKRSTDGGSTFPDTIGAVSLTTGNRGTTTTTITNAALNAADWLRCDITAITGTVASWMVRLSTLSRNQ